MGQRANLFEEARNTINVLKSKAASKHTYMRNFPMSIMRVTRRHLYTVSHELIDAFEKNRYTNVPALMKRYYKLNQLHISQLTRYLWNVPVECACSLRFNRYQIQSLYDPLWTHYKLSGYIGGEKVTSFILLFFFSSYLPTSNLENRKVYIEDNKKRGYWEIYIS